jgi:hypothetical protein
MNVIKQNVQQIFKMWPISLEKKLLVKHQKLIFYFLKKLPKDLIFNVLVQ